MLCDPQDVVTTKDTKDTKDAGLARDHQAVACRPASQADTCEGTSPETSRIDPAAVCFRSRALTRGRLRRPATALRDLRALRGSHSWEKYHDTYYGREDNAL